MIQISGSKLEFRMHAEREEPIRCKCVLCRKHYDDWPWCYDSRDLEMCVGCSFRYPPLRIQPYNDVLWIFNSPIYNQGGRLIVNQLTKLGAVIRHLEAEIGNHN